MTVERAYASLICGGDGYLPGLETLGRSLAETGTTVPRVALVTADVSAAARARLVAEGWLLRDVEPIGSPTVHRLVPRYAEVFTKLRVWG